MPEMPRVLVIDDDPVHLDMLITLLRTWHFHPVPFSDGISALDYCQKNINTPFFPDLALVDMRMPGLNGKETLKRLLKLQDNLPVILMTAYSDVPDAVESMRLGARDYLVKPLNFPELEKMLHNVPMGSRLKIPQIENQINENQLVWGNSKAMMQLRQLVETVGPTEAHILITGESGTGKELIARSIHKCSKRACGPFLAINCGAFTESLLASELFGHEKGAFTGAEKKHNGLFMEAKGGSLFLDEIGEMPLPMQVKLLRVLQEKEVLSVGGKKPVRTDCRIIAATNKNLPENIKNGTFREDLYYRLNVVSLHVPALRDRREDIPQLAEYFARRYAATNNRPFEGISCDAMEALSNWSWPGNVRELENVMERAAILMLGNQINIHALPENLIYQPTKSQDREAFHPNMKLNAENQETALTLAEVERNVIMETLRRTGNNKTETAKLLGITRKTLHAKLNKYSNDS